MKGVTEELASEIKTEIREVIATVDNVLSENADESNGQSAEKKFVGGDFRRTSSTPMLSNAYAYGYSPAVGSNNVACNG